MRGFGAFFGCRGDGGFNGRCSGARSGDVGFKVPMGGVPCAKKFALLDLMVGVSAKKFALRGHNRPKLVFSGVLGELFRGNAAEGVVLGEFFRANWPCAGLGYSATHFRLAAMGVCAMRSPLTACRRRVGALDGVIPPIGDGDLAVCGGVVAKLQTHSVKRVQIRLFRLNGSTIWRNRSLSWCVVRASPPEHAPQSLVAHSAACRGINRLTSCESCYTTVLSSNEAKSGRS